jgi:hypothetical protein
LWRLCTLRSLDFFESKRLIASKLSRILKLSHSQIISFSNYLILKLSLSHELFGLAGARWHARICGVVRPLEIAPQRGADLERRFFGGPARLAVVDDWLEHHGDASERDYVFEHAGAGLQRRDAVRAILLWDAHCDGFPRAFCVAYLLSPARHDGLRIP